MQVWKGAFHWNPGVRAFNVLSRKLPGLCDDCAGWLRARRLLASVVMIVPFVVLAALAGTGTVGYVLVVGMYGLYLVRTASYGFADGMLYGDTLEEIFKEQLPHHPGADVAKESVRFPAGIAFALGRLALASALGRTGNRRS